MPVDLLSVLLDGLLAAGVAAPPSVLPPLQATQAQLGNDAQAWRALLVRYIESDLAPRYRALPSAAVAGAPGGAPQRWDLPPRLRQVMTAPAAVPGWSEPETNGLDRKPAEPTDYAYKLRGLQAPADIAAGFDLLGGYLSSQSLPASAHRSRVAARQSLNALIAFNAFLVRLGACISAAAGAQVSLAEALALYRTEGDLVAPMSAWLVEEGWPCLAHEKLKGINLGNREANHGALIFATMERGLWSLPFASLKPPSPNLPLVADRPKVEPQIKAGALQDWMLVIAGHDLLFGPVPFISEVEQIYKNKVQTIEALGTPSFTQLTRDTVTAFMSKNRAAAGMPSALKDQQDAFDAVIDDLTVRWPTTADGRIAVVPRHPERLVAFTLTEALLLLRRNKDQGGGPFIEPPATLKYLAYNLQHARSNVKPEADRFIHLLASAAVAANKDNRPRFAALKAQLAPLGLVDALTLDPGVDSSQHVAEFQKLTDPPSNFLSTAANLDMLADYVLCAPAGPWHSFVKNRANLSRYHKLRAYYAALLA